MRNNFYIKPNLLNTSLKENVFDRQKEFYKEIDNKTIRAQVIWLICSILIMFLSPVLGLIGIGILVVLGGSYYSTVSKKVTEKQNKIAQDKRAKEYDLEKENVSRTQQAIEMANKLNEILDKSEYLRTTGIYTQLNSIKSVLNKIKFEFEENALIPFWDEIENFVKEMNSYEESLRILELNKKTYYQIIHSTENNFPKTFPTTIDNNLPEKLINDFKAIQREAFKKFEYANLWEQRKTQKILAFGFSNLQDAINNMSDSIVSAIYVLNDSVIDLNNTVSKGFSRLSEDIQSIKLNNLQDMTATNNILESNLKNIDNKLYYIQYNRKPIEPFGDIFAPNR